MNRSPVDGGRAAASLPEVIFMENADLVGTCEWVPTDVQPGGTPLPIYPQAFDPQFAEIDEAIDRANATAAGCRSTHVERERRA